MLDGEEVQILEDLGEVDRGPDQRGEQCHAEGAPERRQAASRMLIGDTVLLLLFLPPFLLLYICMRRAAEKFR